MSPPQRAPESPDLKALFRTAPWRTAPEAPLPSFPPGCLLAAEGRMLYHLSRAWYRGKGAIVDCGAFLGRSAAILAQGVMDNPQVALGRGTRVVHSFDWFRVADDHDVGFILDTLGLKTQIGESTRVLFDRNVGPWNHLIHVHEGDFNEQHWACGDIEILFLDICKTPTLNGRVVTEMFPALRPETAVVVQQDYHHAHHPAIHLSLEMLADEIEPLATRVDDSFVFRPRRQIPPAKLAAAASVDRLPPGELVGLMDAAIARLPGDEQHFVRLARAVLLSQTHGKQAGFKALAGLAKSVPDQDRRKWDHELDSVIQRIANH